MADLASGGRRLDGFPESVGRKVPDEYDHDRISIYDLVELGVTDEDFSVGHVKLPIAEVTSGMSGDWLVPPLGSKGVLTTAGSARQVSDDSLARSPATNMPEFGVQNDELATGLALDASDSHPFEALDFDEGDAYSTTHDPLDQLWYLEVPEANDDEVAREISRAGVSSDERARQLALAFLLEEGLHSERHLDLLTDIIQQRGWSGVQTQVRGLVLAGYEIVLVHRMFGLTDAWLHCVESDTLAPERWHGGKRLTWFEAAQLLDFLGHDAELEQIADFLSSEQEAWHRLRRDSGQLATFKNYLFEYRLSPRTQVDDGIWQSNLDPGDTRSFDGSRNPLYMPCWWDEPIDDGALNVRQMFGVTCDPARIADWLSPDTEELF